MHRKATAAPPLGRPLRFAAAALAPALCALAAPSCGDDAGDAAPISLGAQGGAGAAGSAGDCPADLSASVLGALRAVPGLDARAAATEAPSACAFDLEFEQPIDHLAPGGPRFRQRARLLHRSASAPLSLASTGYALFGRQAADTELSALLGANLLVVEHRYFPPSSPPEPRDWARLTIEQAAADHHRFVEALRPLYPGPWLSEGVSKGGMASVYHRRFYPGDVVGTVAYVTPQSESPVDPRYGEFLERVGDAGCRERLVALQREALASPRRERLVDTMVSAGAAEGHSFDFFGPDRLFEFAIGEARFLFWQYQEPARCAELPAAAATDDALYAFFDSVSFFSTFYDDESLAFFGPYYYQVATQLGGPAPLELHLEGLLRYPGENLPDAYPPAGVPKAFDPAPLDDVASWLTREGERFLFVYGEYDPWTAGAFDPGSARDTLRLVVPQGNHDARLLDLPEADRARAFDALAAWTGVTPRPPPGGPSALASAPWRARPPRRAPRLAP
ncbi:MAG TPA: S28 family serine protease [Polyangiaceae bacterium]|nr:S28 family serine protease [Polyangiaceae bacterium]